MFKQRLQISTIAIFGYIGLAAFLFSFVDSSRNIGSGRRIYSEGFPIPYYVGLLEFPTADDIFWPVLFLDYLIAVGLLGVVAWLHLLLREKWARQNK